MIFQNPSETANLLAQKIQEENFPLDQMLLSYIDPDDQKYCQLIADKLKTALNFLPPLITENPNLIISKKYLVIADSGQTRGQEYNEFTDQIRKISPTTKIILAIPIIAKSEEKSLKENSDELLTLHIEPLFFSLDQFYVSKNY